MSKMHLLNAEIYLGHFAQHRGAQRGSPLRRWLAAFRGHELLRLLLQATVLFGDAKKFVCWILYAPLEIRTRLAGLEPFFMAA